MRFELRTVEGWARLPAWLYFYSVVWLVAYVLIAFLALGCRPVLITGGSMEPGIHAGDLVLLTEVTEPAGRAAVVTYRSAERQGELVTHRIVEVLPDGYRTQGDANLVPDGSVVPHDAVIGAGRLLIPALGRPVLWLRAGEWTELVLWVSGTAAALLVVARDVACDPGSPAAPRRSRGVRRPGGPASPLRPSAVTEEDA